MKEKKIKLIQLTTIDDNEIFINVEMIGHIYNTSTMIKGYQKGVSVVAVSTHNNGGFKVKESIYQILELINN